MTSTLAFGIAAPEVSRTWPFTIAVGACAREITDQHKKIKASTPMRCFTRTSLLILFGCGASLKYTELREERDQSEHANRTIELRAHAREPTTYGANRKLQTKRLLRKTWTSVT